MRPQLFNHLMRGVSAQAWNRGGFVFVRPAVLRYSTTSQAEPLADMPPKPFSSIPGPKTFLGLTIWDYFRSEKNTMHKYFAERGKKYGPIYRERLGPVKSVLLQDPEHIQQMLKAEGKYPSRTEIVSWKLYRKGRDLPSGTLVGEGEEWQKNRSALNRHMMRPLNVATHTDDFNDIVTDFMALMQDSVSQNNGLFPDMKKKLFCWSLEAGCMVIFDERFGCLSSAPPPHILEFMDGVRGVFETTEQLMVIPEPIAKMMKMLSLPLWKKHAAGWDAVYEIGGRYCAKKIAEAKEQIARDEEVSSLIGTLVLHSSLTEDEIRANCVDLMAGAVETTAHAIQWILYMLSKNPDKQRLLYEEIQRVLPSGGNVGQKELRQMPFIKAVLKETLRLYPVAPFTSRILPEDAVIGGYHIEKGTLVIAQMWNMSRDPKIYQDPESFVPERWLRENLESDPINPYANLQFGHGPRACIGRRIAELEMFLLISRIVQKYEIVDTKQNVEIDSKTMMVLLPKSDLNIAFKERSSN